ncbi:MAG TPA: DUF1552 domain-containing protein [Terriglobia bacterium]|nr:DUF1552 domain-containing protein [Terriglobia bacterium]
MFNTRKSLPRRTFLRGAGATLALPLLDAMIPASTAFAQTAAVPKTRMGFLYFPHGANMNRWTPATTGFDFEITPILKPLEPYRKYLTVVSGLENKAAIAPPVHALSPGTWLSGAAPRKSQAPWGGITIDQMAARHLGKDTPLPSLELCIERAGFGAFDHEYGSSYSGTLAFRTPSMPLPMEDNPRKIFQRLFGLGDTAEDRKIIGQQYKSLLDLVSEEATDLGRNLSVADRAMLGDYLETVRELERRVQKMDERDLSSLNVPEAPTGAPESFEDRIGLMFDLIGLAFQGDLTRVFTLMMQGEGSGMTFPAIGVRDAFHATSHHAGEKTKLDKLEKIQTYNTQIFAGFVRKLAELPDAGGSMLDHSILLFGSNMSDSNRHNHAPLPAAIVGGGNGKIKGNQHLRFPEGTPHSNLLLTLANRAGIPVEKVGDDGTKAFSEV